MSNPGGRDTSCMRFELNNLALLCRLDAVLLDGIARTFWPAELFRPALIDLPGHAYDHSFAQA
jgi:hypothetical protein